MVCAWDWCTVQCFLGFFDLVDFGNQMPHTNNVMFKCNSFLSVTMYTLRFVSNDLLGERFNSNNNNFNTLPGCIRYPYRMCRCLKCALPNRLHTSIAKRWTKRDHTHSVFEQWARTWQYMHCNERTNENEYKAQQLRNTENKTKMQRNLYIVITMWNKKKKSSKIVRRCLLKSASPSVWYNVMIQYSFRPRRD